MVIVWLIGFWGFAGFVPPPDPNLSGVEIKALFSEHTTLLRVGLLLTGLSSALLGPYIAVITMQMRRIEGALSTLSYVQLSLGALLIIEFIIPVMILQAAAFRPDISPDVIRSMNDVAWLMFVGIVSTAALQILAIGVAILRDHGKAPVFPRWGGYFCIWAGLLIVPGGLCVLFKTGPFAWNGIYAWWIGLVVFVGWLAGMTRLLLLAVRHQERHGPASGPEQELLQTVQRFQTQLEELRRQTADQPQADAVTADTKPRHGDTRGLPSGAARSMHVEAEEG